MGSKQDKKKDMLNMLMGIEDEDGSKLSDEEIVDLIIMFLNAGHESSGHAAMWAIVLLQDHPEIFQKSKEEQEDIVSRRPPNQKGLTLKETRVPDKWSIYPRLLMRRYVWLTSLLRYLERQLRILKSVVILYLKDGLWRILTWLRSAHFDSDKCTNSKENRPSRWDDFKTRASFIPFGAGNGMCQGRDLAKLELYTFLHYFLLNYKLERINPGNPVKILADLKCRSSGTSLQEMKFKMNRVVSHSLPLVSRSSSETYLHHAFTILQQHKEEYAGSLAIDYHLGLGILRSIPDNP